MKKLILTFCLILAISHVFAQHTLTSANNNLNFGDSYRYDGYIEATNTIPGSGGANLVWDFSNIIGETFIEGLSAICVDPVNTPFADSTALNNANICVRNEDDPSVGPYQYINNTTSSQDLLALGYLGTINSFTTYTNILTAFEYPISYNDSYNDHWEYIMYNINDGYYFVRDSAYTIVEADAYGTITTPLGEFQNTLRLKRTTISYFWMRVEPGGEWIPNEPTTDIEYSWFTPNIKVPVMIILEYEGMNSYNVRYLMEYNFNTGIVQQSNHHLSIFPNPTTDFAKIKTKMPIQQIQLYNLYGQQIDGISTQTNSLLQELIIDLSDYQNGVYLLELIYENGEKTSRKIIKH